MKPNVIPTPESFDRHRDYLYDDPSIIESFKPADCQREPDSPEVRRIAGSYLNGYADIVPPITVNLHNLAILDGIRRYNAYRLAVSRGYKGQLAVRFIYKPDKEEEFTIFRLLNSGEKTTTKHLNGYACSADGLAPNIKKLYGIVVKYPKFLSNKNGLVNVQNLECLVYGEKKKDAVRYNGDYPEVTDEMLDLAEKVAQESEEILNFKKLDLGGNSCRDFFVVWRRVRQNPDVSAVVDRLGLAKVSELMELNAINKPFGKTYGVKRWMDVLSFLF